jgi:hypothetical protein
MLALGKLRVPDVGFAALPMIDMYVTAAKIVLDVRSGVRRRR